MFSGVREASGGPAASASGGSVNRNIRTGQGDASTLTAASLIDAIITHQINQTSSEAQAAQGPTPNNTVPQQQVTRPGDRLFQVGVHSVINHSFTLRLFFNYKQVNR